MTRLYDPVKLAEFSTEQLNERVRNISLRVETRMKPAYDEERDLRSDELEQLNRDRESLAAHQEALEIREAADIGAQVATRAAQIGAAIEQAHRGARTANLSAGFAELEQRAMRGEGGRLRFSIDDFDAWEISTRSTTTANAGGVRDVPMPTSGTGIWLPRESGAVNLREAPGTKLEVGVYAANTAVTATTEGSTKPTLDPSSLASATVSPYAVSSNVTIQSEAAGRGMEQFTWAATRKVRRSVNDAFTAALVTAAGSPRAFATSAVVSLDGGIAAVMADSAGVPDLIVCDSSLFSALAVAGGGNDSRGAYPSYRGIRLVPSTLAALAGNALIVDGSVLAMSLSDIEVRTQPQVLSNSTDAVVEAWFAVASRGASGVVVQDCTTP